MAKESLQKKLSRVRPPRVHITYDVETGGAIQKREIPFIVGVLADLAGQQKNPPEPISEREFVEIDRDNFDTVMSRIAPRLAFKVDNKLSEDDTRLGVELNFQKMSDFDPINIVKQIEPLNKLHELRSDLANLRSNLFGNTKLEQLLQEIIQDSDALNKLAEEAGSPSKTEEE